jgi:GAF domain-containing protein
METFFPIRRSGVLIGLLALGVRRSGHPYSSMDRALIATLADQTAVALENATLFDRVRQRAEQLAMLNEIGRMLTSSLDIQQIVSLLSDRLAGAFQATCGHIFLLDQDGSENLVLRKAFGSCAGAAGTIVVQPGQGLVGWVASEGRPVIISDPPTQQQYAPDIDGLLMPDARVALGVPILAKGKTAGVILVADAAPNRLGATEMNLMDAIASFASIAIENAQEVAAREEALRRQVAALQIQIDETKRARDVEAITGTDYFQRLRSTANQLRRRHSAIALAKEESASIPPPATVSPLFSELNTFVNGLSAVGGVTPMAYLDMPAPLRLALNKTARSGPMTRQAFAAELGLSDDETRQIIALLISKGIVLPAGESPANGETMYRLRFGRRPRSRPGIAQKITFD